MKCLGRFTIDRSVAGSRLEAPADRTVLPGVVRLILA